VLNFDETITGTGHRNQTQRGANVWLMLFIGLTIGLAVNHFTAVQPMKTRMQAMELQMESVHLDMQELIGVRGQVWKANNLLASLRMQQRQIDSARVSLDFLRQFRSDVETEAGYAVAGQTAVGQIASLQEALQQQQAYLDDSLTTVDDLSALQASLLEEHRSTAKAMQALGEMSQLQQIAITDAADVDRAAEGIGRLSRLKSQAIAAAVDVAKAGVIVGEFNDLKSELLTTGSDTGIAHENARRLLAVKDDLAIPVDEVATAERNLDSLLEMQTHLSENTDSVISAIQSLELLSDFQEEFQSQVSSLQGIRRQLLEIVLLESTVARTARTLQPLLEIVNLRRLGDSDVREAARVILESRNHRLGQRELPRTPRTTAVRPLPFGDRLPFNPETSGASTPEENVIERIVPDPIDND
jgi:hypothetical protein